MTIANPPQFYDLTVLVFVHRDAYYKYEIKETYEAGVELMGWEVNAIKHGNIALQGSFVKILGKELYLVNANIAVPAFADEAADPERSRRLLVKRAEIAARYIKKGSLVTVAGTGHIEIYEGKSGPGAKISMQAADFTLPPKPKGDDL